MEEGKEEGLSKIGVKLWQYQFLGGVSIWSAFILPYLDTFNIGMLRIDGFVCILSSYHCSNLLEVVLFYSLLSTTYVCEMDEKG